MTATIGVTLILLFGGLLADRNATFALSILALALFFLAGGKLVDAVLLLAFFPTVIPLVIDVFGEKRSTFGLLLLALFTVRLGWLYFSRVPAVAERSSFRILLLWTGLLVLSASVSMSFELVAAENFYWLKMLGVSFLGLYCGFFLSRSIPGTNFLRMAWSFAIAGCVVVGFYAGSVIIGVSGIRLAYPLPGSTTSLATYFLLAILLLIWVTPRSRFIPARVLVVLCLTFGTTMTQSRSVFSSLLLFAVVLAVRDVVGLLRSKKIEFGDLFLGTSGGLLVALLWQDRISGGGLLDNVRLDVLTRDRGSGGGLLDNVRLDMWGDYLVLFLSNPFVGIGFIVESDFGAPHSLPVELLARLGILGFLIASMLPAVAWFRSNAIIARGGGRDRFLLNLSVVCVLFVFALNNWFVFLFPIGWFFFGLFYGRLSKTNFEKRERGT